MYNYSERRRLNRRKKGQNLTSVRVIKVKGLLFHWNRLCEASSILFPVYIIYHIILHAFTCAAKVTKFLIFKGTIYFNRQQLYYFLCINCTIFISNDKVYIKKCATRIYGIWRKEEAKITILGYVSVTFSWLRKILFTDCKFKLLLTKYFI